MSDTANHAIMAVELEDGLPTAGVALDVVRSGLASEDDMVRSKAARVAAGVARQSPDRAAAIADALGEAIEDDHSVVLYWSVVGLSLVTEEHPERVGPAVDRLVELLSNDMPDVRTIAARALIDVGLDDPGLLKPHVDALLSAAAIEMEHLIEPEVVANTDYDDQARTLHFIDADNVNDQVVARRIAANLLVEVAETDPAVIEPYTNRLVDLLKTDDVGVATAAADILGSIAEDNPDAVSDAVGPLCDQLDHPDEGLVATAIAAIGLAGGPEASEPLRDVAADEDRSDDLRAFATETADALERTSPTQ